MTSSHNSVLVLLYDHLHLFSYSVAFLVKSVFPVEVEEQEVSPFLLTQFVVEIVVAYVETDSYFKILVGNRVEEVCVCCVCMNTRSRIRSYGSFGSECLFAIAIAIVNSLVQPQKICNILPNQELQTS